MSELFNTIKTSILGTKSSDIDSVIDKSFQNIDRYSVSTDRNRYIEFMKDMISKTGTGNPDSIMKGLQQGNPQVQTFDQSGRISRYGEYQAITRKISYCQRALETLVDHIISPDDITKTSITIMSDETKAGVTNPYSTTISRCKEIEKKIMLDSKIKKIVRTTLHKGDNFIEIIASPKGQNALTILHEGSAQELPVTNEIINLGNVNQEIVYEVTDADGKKSEETRNLKIQLETTSFGGALSGIPAYFSGANISGDRAITNTPYKNPNISKDPHVASNPVEDDKFKSKFDDPEKQAQKDDNKLKLRDVFITVHNPKYIIRLETERFKTCLGFLVFPKIDPSMIVANSSMMSAGLNSVDSMCAEIINSITKQLNNTNDKINISADMKASVLTYLNSIKKNDDLKIRYVPPELMVHFRINADLYDPYGESIFECVNFDCRLLIALKTAKTIKQLTFATDKRVIAVETGLPRDAKNIIESIKESMNKKKISVDTMGSIDNIPSQIPTFETIYIPMRDGKKFVEFDKMEWGMNPNDDVEGLKMLRDGIVGNLGVPAPYLGLEENSSNRSLLTVENINFTRTIISYQKDLSIPLKELFEKIYKLIWTDYENLSRVVITFQEPKISPYEHQMEYVEQIQRLIEALKALGIPISWLKKKYLPDFDWEAIEKMEAEEVIDAELGGNDQAQQGGASMGGFGGM